MAIWTDLGVTLSQLNDEDLFGQVVAVGCRTGFAHTRNRQLYCRGLDRFRDLDFRSL